ncbi:RNA polymerase II transcription factor B subunit 4 [Recurvomyces mirabilis]|uniref:General transcription and DNA repair factor IIH subunit TFB4 n=1 Tax=Recurvomyces mirabilis TaxID=574656 RepID=A0AAE0WU14_9PEZI|nr:RNA polymerase II transcription factor B subunit 4 [Recurvomyces mirabilis]KAK5160469.1 RNA polymerase II transcription factor B subunit 4 [Recurvomyces mirabilis]
MNVVDATDRAEAHEDLEPPSLLTIILDTNPHAWALLGDSLPLSKAVANLLVFINAHLAINYANRVAVIASHAERAAWLYPTPAHARKQETQMNGSVSNSHAQNGEGRGGAVQPPDDANKYRPFAQMEYAFMDNLRKLMDSTTTEAIQSSPSTMLAGALTRALAYISKQTSTVPTTTTNAQFNYSDPSSVAGGNDLNNDPTSNQTTQGLTSRVLIVSVSGDLADKYIEIMNSIFACQRLSIPIDILKLAGDPVFLQQAADTTGGIYMSLSTPQARAGLLQYLMFAYLPDQTARDHLIMPGEDGTCLLCGSHLSMANYGQKPAVVPRKKKGKKKRIADSGVDTPGSGSGTPIPV